MWNDDVETNDRGELVKLYSVPQTSARKSTTVLEESHLGGHAWQQDAPKCSICQDDMYLLVQLKLKKSHQLQNNILCVFGCPRSSCFEKITFTDGFCIGGQGVLKCTRTTVQQERSTPPVAPVAPVKASWYDDKNQSSVDKDKGNDWAESKDTAAEANRLEQMLANMEANLDEGGKMVTSKDTTPKLSKLPKSNIASSTTSTNGFGYFALKEQNEPLAPKPTEDDDVGMGASDDKIRNMLARYMAEEEDEDILAAIKGNMPDAGEGGANGEEDERLSPEDRVLRTFQDRIRRVPRQVVRYAKGGTPIWSIPTKSPSVWKPPQTSNARTLEFECQLLPSILHILDVDKYAGSQDDKPEGTSAGLGNILSTGMNWGSIAIFSCSEDSDACDDILVIQQSVDEGAQGQNTKFDSLEAPVAVMEDLDDDEDFEQDF